MSIEALDQTPPQHRPGPIRARDDVSLLSNTHDEKIARANKDVREVFVRPYSYDIRIRVVQACRNGEGSQRQIARRYNVSLTFVQDLLKRYRETGNIIPRRYTGGHHSKIDDVSLQLILTLVDHDPLLPLSRLCERLAHERQLRISRATMWRTLRKHRPNKNIIARPTDSLAAPGVTGIATTAPATTNPRQVQR